MHTNLPTWPREPLIGRANQQEEIKHRLAQASQLHLVSIAGAAGIGKSALAMDIARYYTDHYADLRPDERFRAVVWIPLIERKSSQYQPFGRSAASPSLYRLFCALAQVFDAWHILRAAPQGQTAVAREVLAQSGPVLLIVDDFDATDDVDIRAFLRERLPLSCKALLTVRIPEDLPRPIELTPLAPDVLTQILHDQVPRYDERIADERIGGPLSQIKGVTPFTVQLAAGMVLYGGTEYLREWTTMAAKASTEAGLDFLVSTILHHLQETASATYDTLLALTFFDRIHGATPKQVCAAAGIDLATCEACITQLATMRLIEPALSGGYIIAHSSIWATASAAARANPAWEAPARDRWVAFYREVVQEAAYGTGPLNNGSEGAPLANVLSVMEWLGEQHRDRDQDDHLQGLAWFFQRTEHAMRELSLWDPLLTFADQLSIWGEDASDVEAVTLSLQTAMEICALLALTQQGELWLKRAQTVASRKHNTYLDEAIARARARLYPA